MRKKIYKDPEHPSIVNTLYSIAQQVSNLGQHQKSLDAFQDVLGTKDYQDIYRSFKKKL